ncbi:MAG: FAD-binding protein [Candidatus Aminicenantes bacterium]|nr:FAD-binding protein [Candidatus Aminicenantes bacterium]NIM81822.1 FAD-binding protein [Candidatus Aminicenantes bacterium]NIN21195.1 FAD-binding protein [Candidatus Aminicenantes bacterium]NIN45019.1 FAD-binding protein [Candidatus Aminicenantes bacterium]NIN87837.1 FAD-binding protein [Candidatus Aminicenantes bacterium]
MKKQLFHQFEELYKIVGEKNLLIKEEQMLDYSHDEFPDSRISQVPLAVVKPVNTHQVSEILKWANKANIPVTPRGGGTGLCGGCIPVPGGIVLSLEDMNHIIEIDCDNRMAVVEAGVRLMDFYEAVEKENLFFPPHPGDESATIGGVIATNAGGARAVKYGVVRNFVKGIEVVLPDGEIIQLGGKVLKNSTGYSLLHLMIGSEGTLGIVTKAILNLIPPPKAQMTLIAPFYDLENAIQVVPGLAKAGILPMAVEFIEVETIRVAEDFLKKKWPCQEGKAHLMIILDGTSDDEVLRVAEQIGILCGEFGVRDVFVADTPKKQREILEIRSNIYETIKKYVIEILDIVLPPSAIPGHVNTVHRLSRKHNMWLPTFGHAADGNVHTLPLRAHYLEGKWKEIPEFQWKEIYPRVRKALHDDARKRGGLVSGEHGIGLVKKEYLDGAVGSNVVGKMRLIKKVFDPNGVLNPGKIF